MIVGKKIRQRLYRKKWELNIPKPSQEMSFCRHGPVSICVLNQSMKKAFARNEVREGSHDLKEQMNTFLCRFRDNLDEQTKVSQF